MVTMMTKMTKPTATSTLADSVKAGVESVPGVTATVYQIAGTLSEEILSKMHAPPKKDYRRDAQGGGRHPLRLPHSVWRFPRSGEGSLRLVRRSVGQG
ncbi:hypothetical protein DVH05_022713 [Phytophthora capsici]|nr:hypothetical protein DVH05_022711 [Phytophthora capsici]KAG1709082.1 hypothetical protein DVH05_022713 [Phytophthora capsici]